MKNKDSLETLELASVRRAFDKAANSYDDYAVLQRSVADELLDTLTLFTIKPSRIADLGSGTGYSAPAIAKLFPKAKLILCDISESMLKVARAKSRRWFDPYSYLCADIGALPFAENSLDIVFSSLSFQWCSDLDRLFAECRRVLRPDGLLLFSSLGPDTLKELRAAFSDQDTNPHVHDFIDMHDVGDALIRAGFAAPVLQTDHLTMTYTSMKEVMRDLRGIGAANKTQSRRRGLSTKALFRQAEQRYETFRQQGLLPATYEIVYGHAFSPSHSDPAQDGSLVSSFPLSQLSRRNPN